MKTSAAPLRRLTSALRSDGASAAIVASCSLASTALGFIREVATGRTFGATANTDAFFAAFTLVSFAFFLFAGGAIQHALMPTYQSRVEQGDHSIASSLLRWATVIVLLMTVFVAACILIFADQIVRLTFPGFDEDTTAVAAQLTRIMSPLIVLSPLGNVAQSVLHSQRRFILPSMIPPLNNIAVVAAIVLLGGHLGVFSLAVGYVFGYSLWLLLVMVAWRTYFPVTRENIWSDKRVVAGAFGFLAALVIFDQLSGLVQRSILSQFEPGLISAFTFATRIAGLPVGILAGALAIVLFPRLVSYITRDHGSATEKDLISFGVVVTTSLVVPAALFLAVEADIVVSMLFGGNAFSAEASENTTTILTIYALSLPAQAMVLYLGKVYVAANQSSKLLTISIIAGSTQIGLTYILPQFISWVGVPIATLIYGYIHTLLLFCWMGRITPISIQTLAKTVRSLAIVAIASLIASSVWILSASDTIIFGALRGLLFATLYGAVLYILRERSILDLFRLRETAVVERRA